MQAIKQHANKPREQKAKWKVSTGKLEISLDAKSAPGLGSAEEAINQFVDDGYEICSTNQSLIDPDGKGDVPGLLILGRKATKQKKYDWKVVSGWANGVAAGSVAYALNELEDGYEIFATHDWKIPSISKGGQMTQPAPGLAIVARKPVKHGHNGK